MNCGDPVIDGLVAGDESIEALTSGASGQPVAYLQGLLRGHGYASLGDPRLASYGVYGHLTSRAVSNYRLKNGLPAGDHADSPLLADLVRRPASDAAIGPAYVPLVLDVAFGPIVRFVWLTSLFETAGAFGAVNLNTDQCGVSFGILQWSQKPGQMHVILQACRARESAEWDRIIGGDGILDHTAKPHGGLDAEGFSIDPAFELTKDPWRSKLIALGASPAMQRVQVDVASDVYQSQLAQIRAYAQEVRSQRGFAFLLDLSNQFGAGRVELHYKIAAQPGLGEAEILKALEEDFTGMSRPQFQLQVRARREFFRTTPLLSDDPVA